MIRKRGMAKTIKTRVPKPKKTAFLSFSGKTETAPRNF
jgi:hypothetical protein